jgi:hypothetical protein
MRYPVLQWGWLALVVLLGSIAGAALIGVNFGYSVFAYYYVL